MNPIIIRQREQRALADSKFRSAVKNTIMVELSQPLIILSIRSYVATIFREHGPIYIVKVELSLSETTGNSVSYHQIPNGSEGVYDGIYKLK